MTHSFKIVAFEVHIIKEPVEKLFNSYQQKIIYIIKWIHWKFFSLMLTIFVFNHFLNEQVLGASMA